MRRRTLACALLPLLLAGCGGSSHHSSSSSSSSTDTIGPQIALAWPARSRAFSAPVAATAATVTFPGAGVNGADVTQTVTRPSAAAAVTQTYQLGVAVHPGRHLVRIDFLAGTSSYPPLATAAVNVTVDDRGELKTLDGKDLGTVAYGSEITGLVIAPDQTLEVGDTTDLVVSATTANGIVALTPGSVTFALTAGSGAVSLGTNGSVTALAAGTANLTATTNGVTSPTAAVVVLPPPVKARSYAIKTADLAAGTADEALWVAINGGVARLDPGTGTMGTTISLGADPTTLTLSDDGTTLLVGLQALGTVRKVDLASGTPGASFPLPSSDFAGLGYATDIAPLPGGTSTLAIIYHNTNNSGYYGPAVFDEGVVRANALGTYEASHSVWTSPNRLVAYPSVYGGFTDVAVDAQGATVTRQVSSDADLVHRVVLAGGRLYSANGVVVDANSLSTVGTFPGFGAGASYLLNSPAVDLVRHRAYIVEFMYGGVAPLLHVFDTESFAQIASRRISGLVGFELPYNGLDIRLSLVSSDRLAFRLSDRVVLLDGVSSL